MNIVFAYDRILQYSSGVIMNSATEFGALVRTERKKRGWSQKELASQVGVSALWISQFERGKPTAHIGLVLRTLKTLDLKLWVGDHAASSGKKPINLNALIDGGPSSIDGVSSLKHDAEQTERQLKQ